MVNLEQERGDHAVSSSRNHPGDATLIGAEALLGVSRGQPPPPIAEMSQRPQSEDEDEEERALQPVLPWPPGYPYPYPYSVPGHDLAGSSLLQPCEERLDTLHVTFKGDTWAHYVEFKVALDNLFQEKPRTYSEDNKKTANTSFMTYCCNWEMIEQELLGALDPLNQAAFFVCSLRPEMRMELTCAGLARDWQELCEQGERIEASLRHSVAYRGSDTDYPNNQPRRAPKNAETTSGLPPREPTATSQTALATAARNPGPIAPIPLNEIKCYNCHQMGHYATSCLQPSRRAAQSSQQDSRKTPSTEPNTIPIRAVQEEAPEGSS
ncbi:hypothetical protein S40288_11436 [Stachybotrys chartarum IBT 40288]|nr:hypothetical protein S40288_11436 [Stachybotrys chartarum IBT 40288]